MKNFRWFAALAIVGLTLLSAGSAKAFTITWSDLADPPIAPVTDVPTVIQQNAEDYLFLVPVTPGAVGLDTAFTLTDPGTGALSDYVTFSYTVGSNFLLVEMVSSPVGEGPLAPPSVSSTFGTAVENGTLQTIPLPTGTPAIASGLTITFASDVEAIPEPASLAMSAIAGVVGLGVWARRRRRATVA